MEQEQPLAINNIFLLCMCAKQQPATFKSFSDEENDVPFIEVIL